MCTRTFVLYFQAPYKTRKADGQFQNLSYWESKKCCPCIRKNGNIWDKTEASAYWLKEIHYRKNVDRNICD